MHTLCMRTTLNLRDDLIDALDVLDNGLPLLIAEGRQAAVARDGLVGKESDGDGAELPSRREDVHVAVVEEIGSDRYVDALHDSISVSCILFRRY